MTASLTIRKLDTIITLLKEIKADMEVFVHGAKEEARKEKEEKVSRVFPFNQ